MKKNGAFLLTLLMLSPVWGDIVSLPSCTEQRPEVSPVTLSQNGENKAEAMAYFARFLAAAGRNPGKAITCLVNAVESDPDSSELVVFAAGVMITREGMEHSEQFAAAAGRHCDSPYLVSMTANALLARKKNDTAVKLLTVFAQYAEKNSFPAEKQKYASGNIALLAELLSDAEKESEAEQLLSKFMEKNGYRNDTLVLQQELLLLRKKLDHLPAGAKKRSFPWFLPSEEENIQSRLAETEERFSSAVRNGEDLPEISRFRKLVPILLAQGKSTDVLLLAGSGLLKLPVTQKDFDDLALFYQLVHDPVNEARIRKAALAEFKKTDLPHLVLYASALRRSGDCKQSVRIFRKCLKAGMPRPELRVEAALAESGAGNWKEALKILEKLPHTPVRIRMETAILIKAGQYLAASDKAMQILKFPLSADPVTAGKENRSRALFASLAAEKAGRMDVVVRLMESMIAVFPEDSELLNFLGYSLADRGIELDKAEKLIRKALAKDSANEAVLDSMAWVLYRKKQYAEAEVWIEKSLKAHGGKRPDAEILDHAGDIAHALRKETLALARWEQALAADSSGNIDKRLIRDKMIDLWKNMR